MNTNLLQILYFEIILKNGQTIHEPIENMYKLYEIIHIYGREVINKIIFYFHDNIHKFHNIILHNSDNYDNDRFTIEFYRDYNNGHHIELSYQEQYNDYQSVINILQHNNLQDNLLPFIINSFNLNITL